MAEDLRRRIAEATRAHYLDGTDWEGNDTCVCGGFGDGKDTADWDAHLADAVMAVRDDEVGALRHALAAAEQEVARLRAGEADELPAPGTNYTPAQWIHRWNNATPEERLTRAEHILADAVTASRCIAADHDGMRAEFDHLRCLHVRARAVAESWRAAGMRRADEDGDSMWVGLAHACAQIIAALDGATDVEDADGNPIDGGDHA